MHIYEHLYSVHLGFITSTDRHNINLNTLKTWEKIHWLYQIELDLTKFELLIEGTPFLFSDGFCDALLIDGFMSWTQH